MKVYVIPGWKQSEEDWKSVKIDGDVVYLNIDWKRGYTSIEEIISELVKEIDVEEYVLIGHSYGGKVLVGMLDSLSSKPSKIILIASPNIPNKGFLLSVKKWVSKIKNIFIKKSLNLGDSDWIDAKGTNLEKLYLEAIGIDQENELRRMDIETTVIACVNDTSVSLEKMRNIAGMISNCNLIEVPNVGHNIHMENPTLLSGIINSIIKDGNN